MMTNDTHTITELVSLNVRRLRKTHTLTQEALAEMLDVSKNHISAIEQGLKAPSFRLLQRLIDTLQVRPYELFIDPDDPELLIIDRESFTREMERSLNDTIRRYR